MEKLWEMEDFLQDNNVFTNGIDGRHAHMNSYMAVLSYDAFKKCLRSDSYTKEDWLSMAEEYKDSDLIMEKLVRSVILRSV